MPIHCIDQGFEPPLRQHAAPPQHRVRNTQMVWDHTEDHVRSSSASQFAEGLTNKHRSQDGGPAGATVSCQILRCLDKQPSRGEAPCEPVWGISGRLAKPKASPISANKRGLGSCSASGRHFHLPDGASGMPAFPQAT